MYCSSMMLAAFRRSTFVDLFVLVSLFSLVSAMHPIRGRLELLDLLGSFRPFRPPRRIIGIDRIALRVNDARAARDALERLERSDGLLLRCVVHVGYAGNGGVLVIVRVGGGVGLCGYAAPMKGGTCDRLNFTP